MAETCNCQPISELDVEKMAAQGRIVRIHPSRVVLSSQVAVAPSLAVP
jgi:hypothetical protein